LARNHAARLHKLSALIGKLRPAQVLTLSDKERLEFAQSLAGEILAKASGSDTNGEHLNRFEDSEELDSQAICSLVYGLGRFGYFGPEFESSAILGWLENHPPPRGTF